MYDRRDHMGKTDTQVIQTTDSDRPIVDGKQEPPQLKIDIPANRCVDVAAVGTGAEGNAVMTCSVSRESPGCSTSSWVATRCLIIG
jgi:hypothetical protein